MAFFAVFILRKQTKGKTRAYSVPLYPFMPILAIAGSFFVLGSTLITDTLSCGLSILIGLAGLLCIIGCKNEKPAKKTVPLFREPFFGESEDKC